MRKKTLSLDVGRDAVSAVRTLESVKGKVIEAHARTPLSGREAFHDDMAGALESALDAVYDKDCLCVASFPADMISYRNITIPFSDPGKIAKVLPFELEPLVPFSVHDISIGFAPAGSAGDEKKGIRLLTAFIENKALESFLAVLKERRIEPKFLIPGAYPLTRRLAESGQNPENFIVADIRSQTAVLSAALESRPSFIRTVPLSGPGETLAENLCDGIRRTLFVMEDLFARPCPMDGVFITGPGIDPSAGEGPDLERQMESFLTLPVKRTHIVLDENISFSKNSAPDWRPDLMDTALCMALCPEKNLRDINFRKGRFEMRRNWATHKKQIIATGIFAMVFAATFLFHFFMGVHADRKTIAHLDRQMADIFKGLFPRAGHVDDPAAAIQKRIEDKKKENLDAYETENRLRVVDMLNEISRLIPPGIDVRLSKFSSRGKDFQIAGDTDTFNAVDEMKNRLEKIDMVRNVTIQSAKTDKTSKRIFFKLKADLAVKDRGRP
eukprot:NODE_21_length_2278_cov_1.506265_g19_i0.p1 GENE.NODE_21_length_2278_cov_1.506265_g19_i0~~NODE_21_length_2278_cov_1.506265_g19_i0.p1  ORF type:complete len:498 (-),score=207.41 NODE_21_length_2278_cov_1.506265_g19_i0:196-1689(-)